MYDRSRRVASASADCCAIGANTGSPRRRRWQLGLAYIREHTCCLRPFHGWCHSRAWPCQWIRFRHWRLRRRPHGNPSAKHTADAAGSRCLDAQLPRSRFCPHQPKARTVRCRSFYYISGEIFTDPCSGLTIGGFILAMAGASGRASRARDGPTPSSIDSRAYDLGAAKASAVALLANCRSYSTSSVYGRFLVGEEPTAPNSVRWSLRELANALLRVPTASCEASSTIRDGLGATPARAHKCASTRSFRPTEFVNGKRLRARVLWWCR
mmetsp:Transcript_30516/g.83582  ORF Transcript_30516/g.83582 Transcript_30516/m.83582 type:complete len:268 (+) Transcript_30516:548-1351(+)